MLQLETKTSAARSAAIAGAPINVRSALDRQGTPLTRAARPNPAPDEAERGPPPDEDRPDWPPPEVEAAMRAEAAERDRSGGGAQSLSRRQREQQDTLDGGPLPELRDLMAKVPASTQELLEELFRAKFQTVTRVPAAVLKDYVPPGTKAAAADEETEGDATMADTADSEDSDD